MSITPVYQFDRLYNHNPYNESDSLMSINTNDIPCRNKSHNDKSQIGRDVAEIFMLKKDYWTTPIKYKTLYGLKTDIGVYEMLCDLYETKVQKNKQQKS